MLVSKGRSGVQGMRGLWLSLCMFTSFPNFALFVSICQLQGFPLWCNSCTCPPPWDDRCAERKPGAEAGSDPRGHLWGTWGVYLCAGKPPLADIILSHPPDLTRCDSVIGLAIPAMSGHIQYRGAASGDLYIRISGINRVFLS